LGSGEDGERVVLSCGVTWESTDMGFLSREPGMAKVRRERGYKEWEVWREAWMSRGLLTRGLISLPVTPTGRSPLPLALSH
jgi:hypothetical protein